MSVRLVFDYENHVNVNYVVILWLMPSNCGPESIEWFMEGQAFLAVAWFGWSSSHPSPLSCQQVVSLSQPSYRRSSLLTGEWGGDEEGANIIRRRERLVLNKSFITLWNLPNGCAVWHHSLSVSYGGFDHPSLDPKLQTNWSANRLIWVLADSMMNLRSNDKHFIVSAVNSSSKLFTSKHCLVQNIISV